MFEWESAVEKSRATGVDYPSKPFTEPFEFEEEDYDITEQDFRIRAEDIIYYKTNMEKRTEIMTSEKTAFTVKETVLEIDKMLT